MAKGKMGFEGGKYSAKSGDLSKAQLKRAGATKAAARRTVDIGRTSRATEGVNKGRTLGPGGKPLTGSVKLANGQMAVYKAGKRVINVKRSGGGGNTGGSNAGGSSNTGGSATGGVKDTLSDKEKAAKKRAAILQRGAAEGKARNYSTGTSQSAARTAAIRKASAATDTSGAAKARAAARKRNQMRNTDPYNSLINFAKNNSPVSLINRLAALDTKGKR